MNFLERALHGILNRLFEKRDIVINDVLYLRRWYLKGRGTDSQWFLHNIRMKDLGRDHHDHPWDFVSLVLWGGYTENVAIFPDCGCCGPGAKDLTHTIGSVILNKAHHTHRIDEIKGSTYTLVRTGPAEKDWRFLTRPECQDCGGTGTMVDQLEDGGQLKHWCIFCNGSGKAIIFVDHRTYLGLPADSEAPLEDRY